LYQFSGGLNGLLKLSRCVKVNESEGDAVGWHAHFVKVTLSAPIDIIDGDDVVTCMQM
jgi:hypothetical protein